MIKDVLIYPDKRLKKKGEIVKIIDEETLTVINDLRDTLESENHGVGLAALQIGYFKKILAFKKKGKVRLIFNPKIIKVYGMKQFPKMKSKDGKQEDFLEGCLSFPNVYGTVKRFLSFDLEWEELNEKKNILKKKSGYWEGYEAIIIQHETDHLNGILLIDRMMESNGKIYKFAGEKMMPWSVEKVLKLI
jgi:peptide deformylase